MSPDAAHAETRPLPVGTVTFLLTDVEGSTRLWEQDETVAVAMVSRHYELMAAAIEAHDGVRPVEQGEGDSVVAAFTSAYDAVAAALDAQLSLEREPWPEDAVLRVRAGLHTGVAQLREPGRYAGPTIIRCARLRDLAHGGQTLLSDATRVAVVDGLPGAANLRGLGVHRLKDLGRPERVWQLNHPGLVDEFPSLRSLDTIPNNLPAQLTSLVGRDGVLADLADIIDRHRVVTLTGAGGIGKSRLAAHSAAEAVDRLPEGAWWVDLAAVTDPALVAQAVAATFGLRKERDRPLSATLAEQLRGWEALVVLDNCEQVLEPTARLVDELVQAGPTVRFLVTSREPLGVAGEVVWRVPSLDEAASIELFVDRATKVRPGFDPDRDTLEVIADIAARLDGVPLAIELAAARTRMMHPARIAAGLNDRFRLLTGGGRTALPRQQTLEASVAWSYELLDDQERLVLLHLAVFSAGFTLEAAEAVCADGDRIDSYEVLEVLTRLVDKSLVQADRDIHGRYRLLETIRHYAQVRLAECTDPGPIRDRHLSYFITYAEQGAAGLASVESMAWLARLEREHDNLRAAFDWADGTGRGEECLRLVTALALFWELRAHLGRGGRWFARALSHDTPPSVVRARALWAAAHVALYSDDINTALARAPEALQMATELEDQSCIARAKNTISYVRLWFDPPGAREALQESIELAQSVGDDWAVGDGLKMRTITWIVQDDHTQARPAIEDLRRFAAPRDNLFFLAWSHCGLGLAALRQGDIPTAGTELQTAASLCQEIGDPATGGLAVALLAELDSMTGQHDAAIARLEPFIQTAAASGGDLGLPFAQVMLAGIRLRLGQTEAALALTTPFAERFDHDNDIPMLRSEWLSMHGAALLAQDKSSTLDIAADVLSRARTVAAATGNSRLEALANHHLGNLAIRRDDIREAEDLHHRALAGRDSAGLVPEVIESLEALAALAAWHHSQSEATRLLAAADQIRASLGLPRSPADAAACDHILATAKTTLDEQTFTAAQAEGAALTLADAVAYATRARGERKRPAIGWDSLTPTEVAVVRLAAQGLTNPKIGEKLFISRTTVKTHLAHAFTKLGVATRAELAALATRRGLV